MSRTPDRPNPPSVFANGLVVERAPLARPALSACPHSGWSTADRLPSIVPAPKGQQNSAQGFNPGYGILMRRALKGHQIGFGAPNWLIPNIGRTPSGATFRAHPTIPRYPGLKPWAKFYCPFGAKDDIEGAVRL